jgi:4-hydroxythreonine-4-phosphate dehydrogenase
MRPLSIAISLGDPAGVGPEVTLRAVDALLSGRGPRPRVVLVGDEQVVREAAERLGLSLPIESVTEAELRARRAGDEGSARPGREVSIIAPQGPSSKAKLRASERRPGKPSVAGARLAYDSIVKAVALVRSGAADAICTAPINKEWFDRAGVASTGHTEILAGLTRAPRVRLMMAVDDLRVVLATTHIALRDVPRSLSVAGLRETISTTAHYLTRWWGIENPRVAVAALNPHASDGGVYGDEEARILIPAIRRARAAGVDAIGPVPSDTLFSEIGPGSDAVVAMYHDQGLIPVKQRDVFRAVNVTLGLPFIRTSPDHGTAYDLAGTGRVDPRSMRSALDLALHLSTIERGAR